ncbi:hypothetical protein PUR49_32460 [Streptomyces sp. BE147]|uniref:hypothetical protein n=1 Tax=Streptomyces sp. BE147 TaxID=3002524 RepID=UPI002E771796|nr:hypothetical protein [Streptomyces sp. BE147]MEE1741186.1 hypothetical protein [Streptomyces sp. BE147]
MAALPGITAVTQEFGPLDILQRALDTRPAGLLNNPVRDARGLLPMLWYGHPENCDPLDREIEQLLAVAYLLGGRHRRGYRKGGTWNRLHAGLIVLAGEIAARTLRNLITQEHGPHGFEALDALITRLHPTKPLDHGGSPDPVMAARRMINGHCGTLFDPWQHRAITLLADGGGHTGDQVRQCARISAEVYAKVQQHPETVAGARREAIAHHLASANNELAARARHSVESAERRLQRQLHRNQTLIRKKLLRQWREQWRTEREQERKALARIRQEQRAERKQAREESEREDAWRSAARSIVRAQDRQHKLAEQATERKASKAARERERAAEDAGFLDALTEMLLHGYPILPALQDLEVSTSRLQSVRSRVPDARERIATAYRQGALARARWATRPEAHSPSEREKRTRKIVIAALRTGCDLYSAAVEAGTTTRWIVDQYRNHAYFRNRVIEAYDRNETSLLEDLETNGHQTVHRTPRCAPDRKPGDQKEPVD